LHHATAAFSLEWSSYHSNGQSTEALGNAGNHRRGTRTGATALTCCDENHVSPTQNLLYLVRVVFSCLAANGWICSRAKTASAVSAYVEFDVGIAHQKLLGVGVHSYELDTSQASFNHSVYRVDATAANTDNLENCQKVVDLSHLAFAFCATLANLKPLNEG
jgi:hypothetical protein